MTDADRPAFTIKNIQNLTPGKELSDPLHRGLLARSRPDGTKVFVARWRKDGKLGERTLGVVGNLTIATAVGMWEDLRTERRQGIDRNEVARANRDAQVAAKAAKKAESARAKYTLEFVVEEFLVDIIEQSRGERSAKEVRRALTRAIRNHRTMPAQDVVEGSAAHEIVAAVNKTAKKLARVVRAELRRAFEYAITSTKRVKGTNPFMGAMLGGIVKRKGVAKTKQPQLSPSQAGQLLQWMEEPGHYTEAVSDALELTLRTACRSGEIVATRIDELHEVDGVLWLDIPGSRMKGGFDQSVPLVGRARAIVERRMANGTPFLFPSFDTKGNQKPLLQKAVQNAVYAHSGRSKWKEHQSLPKCPVTGWTAHSLRGTATTMLAEMKCPYEVRESILSHKPQGVATYNQVEYRSDRVQWLTKLNEYLDSLVVE
ncbi:hypothetical protein BH10PSE17_BH10PSE17_25220 [soil metagenome]